MTIIEIIETAVARLKAFTTVSESDVNDAILFIAANSYLPELLIDNTVTFGVSDTATIIGATNVSPIVVETSVAHPFETGAYVKTVDVLGNTAANGSYFIQKLTDTTFSLLGTTGNGAYISGGTCTERDTKEDIPTFHHDIINPVNLTTKTEIFLKSSKQILYGMYSVDGRYYGDIENIAVENETLYALPVPEADQVIGFSCYKKPATYTASDIPTCIPVELHNQLIVNKILMDKFLFIEDIDQKELPNISLTTSQFGEGLMLLNKKYPSPSRQKKKINRKHCFF